MNFDYFYGEQSEIFAFYRTPKVFFTDERFRGLSSDAKILYGILLDRVSMSARNKWQDDEGRVYVYMTISSIEYSFCCAHQKACGLLNELEEFGLIERVRQGQGKPTRIYVKNFVLVWNSYLQKYENHTTGSMEIISQEVCNSASNNTNNNNTNINNNNPILSGADVDNSERETYREYFEAQLEMRIMRTRYPYEQETLEAILDLILDAICSKRKTIRIAGDDKPVEVVKSQFMKLNASHVEYVMDCLKQNSSKVRNIKQYMLATIYNAPFTMECYFQNWVNNDMATGKFYGGTNADN